MDANAAVHKAMHLPMDDGEPKIQKNKSQALQKPFFVQIGSDASTLVIVQRTKMNGRTSFSHHFASHRPFARVNHPRFRLNNPCIRVNNRCSCRRFGAFGAKCAHVYIFWRNFVSQKPTRGCSTQKIWDKALNFFDFLHSYIQNGASQAHLLRDYSPKCIST